MCVLKLAAMLATASIRAKLPNLPQVTSGVILLFAAISTGVVA
ncbi:hypothetical protein QRQ56_35550 [Bradyrhizobium sp. U531]